MLESLNTNTLEYKKLSKEEMAQRGILGRLIGVVADCTAPTRNGRHYSEKLWEQVFENPIVKEKIENGVFFGELSHPADREETDPEKICVCMPELPKKGSDGKLRAVLDILDTPNGRILKSLCDYGSTLGISSRGSGDLIEDFDGNESVDPDTYNCEGFDIVLVPAVKEARLQYVTEALDKKRYNKSLRDKLQEAINKETEENQKIMTESLNSLGIRLNEDIFDDAEPEAGPKPDKEFLDDMDKLSKEEDNFEDIDIDDIDIDIEEKEDPNHFFYKDIEVIKDPDSGKFVCEIDGDDYSFNSEKNAKIWIDINTKDISKSSYIDELPTSTQDEIEKDLSKVMSSKEDIEKGMHGKLSDLEDTVDINKYLKEEQIGRDNTKEDKSIDDVLKPEVEDSTEEEKEEDKNKIVINMNESWNDLNGTEQFAVDRIINAIQNGEFKKDDPEEFEYAVRSVVDMYGDANEYLDPDDPMYNEEGSYGRVKDYLLNDSYFKDQIKEYFGLNDNLTEDVDDIQMARTQLCQILDDWYRDNIASELSNDVKAAGWDSDLQSKYLDFRNYLAPDLMQDIEIEESKEVDNIESEVDTLQEMLEQNFLLEKQIVELNEKLSVSHTMEKTLKEELIALKEKVATLSKNSKDVKVLTEQLSAVKDSAASTEKKLNESKKNSSSKIKSLREELDTQIAENNSLKEDYDVLNRDLVQTKEQYSKKFEKQNQLLEKYKKITNNAVDRYINMQAVNLGVKPIEIKNRLNENFTFTDIDNVCEDLRDYKLNVSMLPFNTSSPLNENVGMKVNNINRNNILPRNEMDDLTDYDYKLAEAYL